MSDGLSIRQDGAVLRITLDRAETGNAVSEAMARALTEALDGAAGSADIVVLDGAGADFCVGRAAGGPPPAEMDAYEMRRRRETIFDCYDAFRRTPIPIVGVVRGRAHGLGCALAGLCDVTLAADNARFRIPEMAAGVLPTMVLSALSSRVPGKALAYLLYSTAEIGAEEAVAVGLASKAIPLDRLDQAADDLIATMVRQPRAAQMGAKEFMSVAPTIDPHSAVRLAQNLHAVVNTSGAMRKK